MVETLSIEDAPKVENDSRFKSLFSFKRNEIIDLFKKAKLKSQKLGFKLLYVPIEKIEDSKRQKIGKLLIVTPGKSGPANKRNLLRRRVKSIFYEEKLYEKPVISILLVYKQALELDFEDIKKFLVDNI